MPGIGMGGKYTWDQPPAFYKMPGEYDYMEGATKYLPKDISKIEQKIKDNLDDIYTVVFNAGSDFYNSQDLASLIYLWNNLFTINEIKQEVIDSVKLRTIGEETQKSYVELKDTINTYFQEANSDLDNIKKALNRLEINASKVKTAKSSLESKDQQIKDAAQVYLDNVKKNGKKYNIFTLINIGKWVY